MGINHRNFKTSLKAQFKKQLVSKEIWKLVIENSELFKIKWNENFAVPKSANAVNLWFDDIKMYLTLGDGRELAVPIEWFPSLSDATPKQRKNGRFMGDAEGIDWKELDEDILLEELL